MLTRRWKWQQSTWGELVAEFLGTFVLIAFGDGVVAMAVAALNQSGRGTLIFQASGDWLLIAWGWGFAVCFAVYVAGGVSGAHINPAVTLAFALRRKFEWRKVPTYWAAQVLGAFVGAALVYANYRYAIKSYEHVHHVVRGHTGLDPDLQHLRDVPVPGLPQLVRAVPRRVDRHRLPRHVRVRGGRRVQLAREGEPGAAPDRIHRRRHRHLLRRQLRVCDQSRPRLRPAHLRLDRGLREDRDARRLRQRLDLLLDPDHRTADRRRRWRVPVRRA